MTSYNVDELKKIVAQNSKGNIGLAQLNFIAGDIEYNAKKIANYIREAQSLELDMVVFPNLSLIGYPLCDCIKRYPIIVEENLKWLKEIAKITKSTVALVGFVEQSEDKYYNSTAVLQNGSIKTVIRKSILGSNNISQEINDVVVSNETMVVNGVKYGFSTNDIEHKNVDVIIDTLPLGFGLKYERAKYKLLSHISNKYKIPTVFVNQVGAIDSVSFSGASFVFGNNGDLISRSKSFEEQFTVVNPIFNIGEKYPLPNNQENIDQTEFSLDYENELERIYLTTVQGIRDYFNKTGFKRAVLGLSGGLDSTICSVLLADALGAENVLGISMPSKITSQESKSDAETLANNLGIHFTEVPIKDMVDTTNKIFDSLFADVENSWDCRYKQSFTQDNIQARSRAMYLWGVSNEFAQCLPIATSDKSELYMGYATINGDMSGGFAPIADITKTKLFALARWLNKNREKKNAIPESIIQKRPGAELAIDPKTGKPLCAEDALMPYEFLDEIIWRVENKNEKFLDLLEAEFIYEKKYNISKEQKMEWLEKFFRRVSTALYKWTILPPSVGIEEYNINKYDFRVPITSKINHKGMSQEEIGTILNY